MLSNVMWWYVPAPHKFGALFWGSQILVDPPSLHPHRKSGSIPPPSPKSKSRGYRGGQRKNQLFYVFKPPFWAPPPVIKNFDQIFVNPLEIAGSNKCLFFENLALSLDKSPPFGALGPKKRGYPLHHPRQLLTAKVLKNWLALPFVGCLYVRMWYDLVALISKICPSIFD